MAGFLILIVDDEPMQRELLEEYLKLSHYKTAHASNGAQGMEMMKSLSPDLVLLDVQMPGMDGFAALEEVRKNSELDHIPILFLSSLDRQHLKVKGLELGADDYITKPFHPPELLARVKAALRRTVRYRSTSGLMSGDLGDVALTDLLQSMELGAKTAVVRLEDMDAEIHLDEGMLSYAAMKKFTGQDALERIFLLEKGAFSVKFNEPSSEVPKSPQPLMSALMGVLSQVDEINSVIRKIRSEPFSVKAGPNSKQAPELAGIAGPAPVPFPELISRMDGDLQENIKTAVRAVKAGVLSPVLKT